MTGLSRLSRKILLRSDPGNHEATNTVFLTDPRYARLARYTGSDAALYRCPADPTRVEIAGREYPRVRSVAMNQAAKNKEHVAATNQPVIAVTFNVTNISSAEVAIRHLVASCGCTAVEMPERPWHRHHPRTRSRHRSARAAC